MKYTIALMMLAMPTIAFCQTKGKATPAAKKTETPAKGTAAVKSATPAGYKHANGVDYKIIKDVPGPTAQIGDVMDLNIIWKISNKKRTKDSTVVNTRQMNGGKPVTMPLMEPKFAGDMAGGLSLLSAGDSAIIRVSVADLQKAMPDQPMPPFIRDGDIFVYEVSVLSVKTKEEAEKAAKAAAAGQVQADDKMLQEYFAKNNIKPMKTDDGVYYTIQTAGTGDNIAKGQTVGFTYTGKLLDGTTFDSNVGKDALSVAVGQGQVIPGMDNTLPMLKMGSKSVMYIPSSLGYGARGQGPIPANSILIFEMEITSVK